MPFFVWGVSSVSLDIQRDEFEGKKNKIKKYKKEINKKEKKNLNNQHGRLFGLRFYFHRFNTTNNNMGVVL